MTYQRVGVCSLCGGEVRGFRGGWERPEYDDSDLQPLTLLTFCVLVLKNGFTVTGESACVDPANFDAEIGRQVARKHAVDKMWPLLGYELKERIATA